MGVIYKLTSPSGKAYIGQTTKSAGVRWQQHAQPAGHLTTVRKAIRKYGMNAFNHEVLMEVPNSELDYYEARCIDVWDTLRNGYNDTPGGDINPMHCPNVAAKHRATWSKPAKRKEHSECMTSVMADKDLRDRIAKGLKATLATPQAKKQRREQMQEAWKDPQAKYARVKEMKAGWRRRYSKGSGDLRSMFAPPLLRE